MERRIAIWNIVFRVAIFAQAVICRGATVACLVSATAFSAFAFGVLMGPEFSFFGAGIVLVTVAIIKVI